MNYVGFEESTQPIAQTQAPSTPAPQWIVNLAPYGDAAPVLTACFAGITALIAGWGLYTARQSLRTAQKALDNWQRQEAQKIDSDLARRILAATTVLEGEIHAFRGRYPESATPATIPVIPDTKQIRECIYGFDKLFKEAGLIWKNECINAMARLFILADLVPSSVDLVNMARNDEYKSLTKGFDVYFYIVFNVRGNRRSDYYSNEISKAVHEVEQSLRSCLRPIQQ